MPTIVDSLVIEFGLDPSAFTKGQKEVVDGIKSTEDQATRAAKEMENRGKQAAQFFSRIRNEALALAAVLVGGAGLKSFTEHMTVADAATGRLAKNLDMSTEELSAWEQVAEQTGTTAGDMAGAFQALTSDIQNFATTGSSKMLPMLQAMGVAPVDKLTGKMRPLRDIFLDIAEWAQGKDPAFVQDKLAQMGISPAVGNVLLQGRAALEAKLAEAQKTAVKPEDADAAQKLQEGWKQLQQSAESLGRTILTRLNKPLLAVMKTLREFIDANKEKIGDAVLQFVKDLQDVDWEKVIDGVKAFASSVEHMADAVGGWGKATELVFALWVGSKFATVLANALALAGAMATIAGGGAAAASKAPGAAAAAGGGLAGLLAGLAGPLAFLAGMWPKEANTSENDFIKAHPELFPPAPSADELKPVTDHAPVGRNWLQKWLHDNLPKQGGPSQSNADIKQLTGYGWTREQAIGILANTQAESSGNPHLVGDNGQAYGLQQWHPDRQADFKAWAGHDIRQSTRVEQLGFLNYELRQGKEKAAGDALAKTKTAADAAEVISRKYERPKAANLEAQRRAALATAIANGPGPAPDPSLLVGPQASIASRAGNVAGNTSKTDVHIDTVNVNAPNAKDSDDIARNINASLKEYAFVSQAANGLA